eukprot:TRINITY_DN2944_c0_g1_i1.p1 TRINITY_DN2944_c0_g1~~TRINITY_DN2944_c0_g1_i1.p1  ORF type:complete len:649 (-),score=105.44 TRINITY_DN2944_c0_g1_i1:125-2071(-)
MAHSGTSPQPSTPGGVPSTLPSQYPNLTNPNVLTCSFTDDALLGKGTFGEVYRCRYFGGDVAVKVVFDATMRRRYDKTHKQVATAMSQLERESRRLPDIRSPYITQFLGATRDESRGCSLLVTELMMGGSLQSSLAKAREGNAPLHPKAFFHIGKYASLGLRYLHGIRISHGDIKPANILLSEPLTVPLGRGLDGRAALSRNAAVKLADFGMSLRADQGGRIINSTNSSAQQGIQGTFAYMAPEGFLGRKVTSFEDAKALDIYALGIVLYEMLSGCEPWGGYNMHTLRQAMTDKTVVTRPVWPNRRHLHRAASAMPEPEPPGVPPRTPGVEDLFGSSVQAVASPTSADITEGRNDYHRSRLCFELENVQAIVNRCWAQEPEDRLSASDLVTFFDHEDRNCAEQDWDWGGGGGAGVFVPIDTDGSSRDASMAAVVAGAPAADAEPSGVGGRPQPRVRHPLRPLLHGVSRLASTEQSASTARGGSYYDEFFGRSPPSVTPDMGGGVDALRAADVGAHGEEQATSSLLRRVSAAEMSTRYCAARLAMAAVRAVAGADGHASRHGNETAMHWALGTGTDRAAAVPSAYAQSDSGEAAPYWADRSRRHASVAAPASRRTLTGTRDPRRVPTLETRWRSIMRRSTPWRPRCTRI